MSSKINKKNIQGTWIQRIGPGFITAALVFGPGSLTVTSSLGASFGYTFLWVIFIATFFMFIFLNMSIRIGLASDCSLLTIIRNKWGNLVATTIGIGIFVVAVSFQAGNSVGAGLAFSELTNTHIIPWIVFFTLASIGLLFFRSFYKILEKLMLVLVCVMLISFLGTLIIIKPSFTGILSGFVPSVPSGSVLLAIALVASSFSVVGAFYQSYLVQEKKWQKHELSKALSDGLTAVVFLGLIGSMILICAAAVLHPLNMTITSAGDMGLAIEPLFGEFAKSLFMVGLFGASFSSLIGNSTIGGTLLSDALGFGSHLDDRKTRFFIMLVMFIGAVIAVWFGRIPIDLIIVAQGLTIFIVPFIGIILFMTAKSEEIVGKNKNGVWSNVFGYMGIILLLALAFRNAYLLLK